MRVYGHQTNTLRNPATNGASVSKPISDAERLLGELLESAPDAILDLDHEGRIVLLNRMAEQLFGYTREELLGQTVETLVPEAIRNAHLRHRSQYLNQPVTRPMGSGLKLEARRKDGSLFPVEISLSPVKSSTGSRVTAIIRDVTERKKLEESQRVAEQRFRLMIETIKDYAIFTLDPEGNVTSWNAGAQQIKGYTAEEIVGKHFSIFYPPELRGTSPAQALALVRKAGKFEEEGWRFRKDGSRFWAGVVITAVRSTAGDVVGFVKLTRDLTERKRAEERRQRKSEDLKDFAYAASHDLQEPLRMITIYSELLASRYSSKLDAKGHQFIGFIVEGAARMDALLRGLREYWQTSECAEEHYSPVHSGEALSYALLNLQESITRSGAVITFDSLPVVWAEQVLLVQLFQNLVGNAIKYRSEKPPEIRITAEQNDMQHWVFSVRDNGIGIDPNYAEKIFDMFSRLHGDKCPGSGIGLAICRKVVERLGGRIWLESMPGCGTDFKFTIPTHGAVTAGN